jgi:hypothetical protein
VKDGVHILFNFNISSLEMDKRGSRNGSSLSEQAQCGGPLGRATLLGTPKDMVSKALEWASVSTGAPLLGNMKGRSFLRAFEIKRYIKRYVKCPVSRYLSL